MKKQKTKDNDQAFCEAIIRQIAMAFKIPFAFLMKEYTAVNYHRPIRKRRGQDD